MFFTSKRCFVILALIALTALQATVAVDDDYDFVKEVLEDEENHYGDESNDDSKKESFQEKQRLKAEEAARQRQAEAERIEQEKADRIAAEREREFERELKKMNDDQKKAALKQKKKDAKVVRSILKAAKNNNLYGVLGMRNWNCRIPERQFNVAGLKLKIPGFTLKQTTIKDVRRAFRIRTKLVHPDKNRDGRAKEAFIALENASSILSDEKTKSRYDEEYRLVQLENRSRSKAMVVKWFSMVHGTFAKTFQAMKAVLGPFATPVIVISALII